MSGLHKKAGVPETHPRRPGVALALGLSGWLVLGLTTLPGAQALRPAAVFAFVLIAPGAAVVRLLPLRDPLERAVLAVALSASLATLLAVAAAIGHFWHPTAMLAALAAACSAAAVVELRRGVPA